MHEKNIVHLDLKPENILCKSKSSHQIKIIDFGLARKLEPGKDVRILFGTPEFVSPEVISYEPVSTTSDMWSVGVVCYVLLSGLSPFMGDSDVETFANISGIRQVYNILTPIKYIKNASKTQYLQYLTPIKYSKNAS